MKNKLLVLAIFLLFVVGSIFTLAINLAKQERLVDSTLASTKLIKNCVDVPVTESVPIYGNCTYEVGTMVCNNQTTDSTLPIADENKSVVLNDFSSVECFNHTSFETKECVVGMDEVKTVQTQCDKESGFVINDIVYLSTQDYSCSTAEHNGQTIVTCDSKYDGNGDGICTSGESCQKFIVYGNSVVKLEKNSKDEFKSEDSTYYLSRAKAEVLSK